MNLKINTLGRKIGFGYALIVIVLAAAVGVTIWQVRNVNETSGRISDLRVPSVHADIELMNGLNHSIAALRGWLITLDPKFQQERQEVWDDEIRQPLAHIEALSLNWTDPENVKRLSKLKPLINNLENSQEEIEQLAISNQDKAYQLMEEKVIGLNDQIRMIISKLMDDQTILMSTEFSHINTQIAVLGNMEWALLIGGALASLMLSLYITRSIAVPVGNAVEVAENIGAGNLETRVDVGGTREIDKLGDALMRMRDSLKAKTRETQKYEWLTSGKNQLNEVLRGDKGIEELANDTVNYMADYTEASIGSVYLLDDDRNKLLIKGKYAYSSNKKIQKYFKVGEGVIGQAAAGKEPIELKEMEEQYLRVTSSLVDAPPKNVYVTPFQFDGETLGVLELGKLENFTKAQKEFIESSMESIGIAMNSAIRRVKIQKLLEETQQQSEELQTQQEELEQSNEELEEQTQKLKEQQEELEASNEELEEQYQLIEEKNKDLEAARTDIELKAKQVEISSKYKSEFLANMSHELRTPLNSLLILSNELGQNKNGNLSEDQIESAQVIYKSGHDLLNLINEILDLSKIEAGKMDLNLAEVSIEEMAQDVYRDFKHSAGEKGLELKTEIDPSLPDTLVTDKQKVEQILRNLISNAIKFTEKGKVQVSFEQDPGQNLKIAVSDTGIGISSDKHEVIFEAFQQAEGGTARKYGGTGLGLSISRELTKLLGGKIILKSKKGEGSVFTLIIPMEIAEQKKETKEPQKKPTQKQVFDLGDTEFVNYPTIEDQREEITEKDHIILIVEDDNEFAKILASQANAKGFKYISAATGEDAFILANKFLPHAIMLDLNLPGMNGHTVLHELKNSPDLRHIPVHIISAKEKSLDVIKSGAVEFLSKPINKKELEAAFTRIESFITRKMKNLLIIEDDKSLRESMVKLIGNGDVICYEAGTAREALKILNKETIDCMVLDLGLPDTSGFEFISQLEKENGINIPPIIVYTGKELTKQENDELQQYAESIIVKGVKSEERLLDETALFLHRTVNNLPAHKQKIITGLYDVEKVLQNKKILLVDDDMRNVFALSQVLKEKDLKVIKAENGKIALDALKKDPDMDLVLMDIMMPEMDGYECLREIRKQKRFRSLPVIALTAKAMKDDRQKCIEAGANDYIAKPINVERLLSLIRIWVNK